MSNFDMKDYVPVNERIDQFYRAHPEGSIQSEIVELTADRVTVKAYAYRTLDDPRPGIGHSSLEIPGKTSFTKGSEIENAETSAWGRAIAALGFEVKRGVASAEEVRNKAADPVGTDMRARLLEVAKAKGIDHAGLERYATEIGIPKGARATPEQLVALIVRIEGIATPSSDVGQSETATVQSESPPTSAAPAPTLDDVLAATGGELIPPKPATPEYQALEATERAAARAYWQKQSVTA